MSGALEKSRELSSTKAGRQSILTMLGITGQGGRYFCPFCQNDGQRHKTPDMSIDGGFKCHRCGWSGDGLKLVQEVKNVSFDEAAAFISGAPPEATPGPEKTKQNKVYPTLEKAVSAMKYGFSQGNFHLATTYDYTDQTGAFQYCVLRFENDTGKSFCQIQRVSGGYCKGLPESRILYGLQAIAERPDEPVYICEGEKASQSLIDAGLLATCSVGGSGAPLKTDWTPLQDRECYILPDNDQPGAKYGQAVKSQLSHAKIVHLPDLPPKGDAFDWLQAGHDAEELKQFCFAAEDVAPEPEPETPPALDTGNLGDAIVLPSNETPIIDAARDVFARMRNTERFFLRGSVVHEIQSDSLAALKPDAMRSRIEDLGRTFKIVSHGREHVLAQRRASLEDCKALLETLQRFTLPEVELILQRPMLFDAGGRLVLASGGYSEPARAYVFGNHILPEVDIDTAKTELMDLLRDFNFVTEADKWRGIAALTTPALRMGRFITDGRCPMFVLEANHEQTGKGTFLDMLCSAYGEQANLVAVKDGGVGGFDESIQQRLVDGRPFIQIDNLRGKLASQWLEMVLTAPGAIGCRIPGVKEIPVDPRRYLFLATSNGMQGTPDLAARCCIIRLIKQPEDYHFHKWDDGGLLEHVEKNSLHYLACVHALIRHWHDAGRPEPDVHGHSFRKWHSMTQGIISTAWPEALQIIDEGHKRATKRMSDSGESFIRQVCSNVENGAEMSASEIGELAISHDIPIPKLRPDADDSAIARMIGRMMAKLFKSGDEITVDGYTITRFEYEYPREGNKGYITGKRYRFDKTPTNPTNPTNVYTHTENVTFPDSVDLLVGIGGEPENRAYREVYV